MQSVWRLAMLAGLIVATPVFAAELPIPPLNPTPARASFPQPQPLQPAPVTIVPSVPDVAREAPPPPAYRDPTPEQPDASPTWLERFGPFLKSQLDMIFTGSITPQEEPRCETGKRRGDQQACRSPRQRGSKATRRPTSMLETPSDGELMVRPRVPDAKRKTGAAAAASPAPATVTVIPPLPRMQPLY
jgi:hypothetical protein